MFQILSVFLGCYNIIYVVKAHEQFRSYTLAKLGGILKSHEKEVMKEAKSVLNVGPLALILFMKDLKPNHPR